MKVNSLVINEKDSVAVAVQLLNKGDIAVYAIKGVEMQLPIITDVPIYHKFAIVPVKNGEVVYKYGEKIGIATSDISIGEHVHTHNASSVRELIPQL